MTQPTYAAQPAPTPAPPPTPAPITVANLWDLKAQPATISSAAAGWRTYAGRAREARDTVDGQADDTTEGTERVVTVELKDLGKHITIEGSDEFKERVQADLDMLRASPRGQMMLDALDQAHEDTKAIAADWPVLGGIAYQGDTFTIKEMTIDNGRANQNDVTVFKTFSQHPSIEYNPRFTTLHDGPPVVMLYHEMSHVYDFEFSGLDDREYNGSDNPGTPNYERAAAGLPIDHDGDPGTPDIIDPNQPIEYTGNGLRDELGAPHRPRY